MQTSTPQTEPNSTQQNEKKNKYNEFERFALFLITAEFTIKNNIRQIEMINIELKSMENEKLWNLLFSVYRRATNVNRKQPAIAYIMRSNWNAIFFPRANEIRSSHAYSFWLHST